MASSRTTRSVGHDRNDRNDVVEDKVMLLVAGERILATHPLREETVISRDPACDVVVPHATLSRKHAIVRVGAPLTLRDLGSRNRTRVVGAVRRGGEPR
jgi:pSer/pThr/pTyr-binding forkhead associated (FHA) protein